MTFSDGKIRINNIPADEKGKLNTLTREVEDDKLLQVRIQYTHRLGRDNYTKEKYIDNRNILTHRRPI